jgi:hypothetical protein
LSMEKMLVESLDTLATINTCSAIDRFIRILIRIEEEGQCQKKQN